MQLGVGLLHSVLVLHAPTHDEPNHLAPFLPREDRYGVRAYGVNLDYSRYNGLAMQVLEWKQFVGFDSEQLAEVRNTQPFCEDMPQPHPARYRLIKGKGVLAREGPHHLKVELCENCAVFKQIGQAGWEAVLEGASVDRSPKGIGAKQLQPGLIAFGVSCRHDGTHKAFDRFHQPHIRLGWSLEFARFNAEHPARLCDVRSPSILDQEVEYAPVLMQLFDLGPTILEWAGVTPDSSFEAVSLNPALEGDDFEGRTHVFCEQGGDVNLTGANFLTMVRSETHKLVHFRGMDCGQLFDLVADPKEVRNLWDDPGSAAIKAGLLTVLMEWHIDSAVQTRDARKRVVAPMALA